VPPLERGAQKRTMAAMQAIAQSMASYRQANGTYPRVSSVRELSRLLGKQLTVRDEWHTPLVLSAEPNRYVLTSYGSDGQPDCVPVEGPTTEFACDTVLANGAFVAWPEGIGIYALPRQLPLPVIGVTDPTKVFSGPLRYEAGDGTAGTFPFCGPLAANLGYEAVNAWRAIHEPEAWAAELQSARESHERLMQKLATEAKQKRLHLTDKSRGA